MQSPPEDIFQQLAKATIPIDCLPTHVANSDLDQNQLYTVISSTGIRKWSSMALVSPIP